MSKWCRPTHGQSINPPQTCIDPVKNCSGVIFEENTYEHTDGRRHQTLDGQAAQAQNGSGDQLREMAFVFHIWLSK
jgi:hypothetical protein